MTIQKKLFIAFLLTTATLIGAMVLLFQWQLDRELFSYMNQRHQAMLNGLADELAVHYAEQGNWNQFNSPQQWRRFIVSHAPKDQPRQEARPPPIILMDAEGAIINDNLKRFEKNLINNHPLIKVAIKSDNRIIGYLASPKREQLENAIDEGFRNSQRRAIRLLGLIAIALSAGIAFIVARHLTAPIRKLSYAASQLTQQHYTIDVDTQRRDELGELARDIQELALRLQQNSDMRQRWFADISHELRTPLSILQGEIEALIDGVRPLSIDRIQSLHQEVGHLLRLVADLYDLAQADLGTLNYQKESLDIGELLDESVKSFEPIFSKAGLQLNLKIITKNIICYCDSDRLRQLFNNLLQNSLRYTDSGGVVDIRLNQTSDIIQLTISDSAPGVPNESLAHLFDHLYRVDSARTRSKGGSGLGLAICQRITEAHQGSISASHSELGGITITVTLPIDKLSGDAV
jgi:two-component system sensor histidine kinase BaeS